MKVTYKEIALYALVKWNGKPIEEVESARELAERLLEQTTEKDSIDSIESVRDLCITLETRMEEVDNAETYDEGMTQLENNIYILTDLIHMTGWRNGE